MQNWILLKSWLLCGKPCDFKVFMSHGSPWDHVIQGGATVKICVLSVLYFTVLRDLVLKVCQEFLHRNCIHLSAGLLVQTQTPTPSMVVLKQLPVLSILGKVGCRVSERESCCQALGGAVGFFLLNCGWLQEKCSRIRLPAFPGRQMSTGSLPGSWK